VKHEIPEGTFSLWRNKILFFPQDQNQTEQLATVFIHIATPF